MRLPCVLRFFFFFSSSDETKSDATTEKAWCSTSALNWANSTIKATEKGVQHLTCYRRKPNEHSIMTNFPKIENHKFHINLFGKLCPPKKNNKKQTNKQNPQQKQTLVTTHNDHLWQLLICTKSTNHADDDIIIIYILFKCNFPFWCV